MESRAIMSFPVPLSPVIRTGTLAAATRPAGLGWPARLGTAKNNVIRRSFAERLLQRSYCKVVIRPLRGECHSRALKVHLKRQTGEERRTGLGGADNVKCTIELRPEYWLVKHRHSAQSAIPAGGPGKGKTFHTAEAAFPQCPWARRPRSVVTDGQISTQEGDGHRGERPRPSWPE